MNPGRISPLLFAIAVASCAMPSADKPSGGYSPAVIHAPFDRDQAAAMLAPGSNALRGSAFLLQRGGGVVTCAGRPVDLTPATAYASERMSWIYGPPKEGYVSARALTHYTFSPDEPEYVTLSRRTKCDAQGKFEFDGVADGTFFVTTFVAWAVGREVQGGTLAQRVTLSGGKVANIIISE